jgi:hypothetical protein
MSYFEYTSWRGVLDRALCDKISQCLVAGRWFSLGTPGSPSNKIVRRKITETLLKVALNTINLIQAGVPQGSVPVPLLFILYINDIAENLISLSRLFEDDTSFSYSSRDELQIKTVIDHDLKELDEWSKKWWMFFNPDKTEIMLFSNTEIPE